jgi:uncharacterized membrane protein
MPPGRVLLPGGTESPCRKQVLEAEMESRAKALGHPVHPMLIVFPLGLFVTGVVFDLAYLINNNTVFAEVGFWDITAGLAGAVVAALFGLVDWTAIPTGTRAKRIGLWHGLANSVVSLLFLISWLYRLGQDDHRLSTPWFILEVIAIALGGVAGWLGGELVDRLGVGVDPNAGVDAPSSLHRPTTARG